MIWVAQKMFLRRQCQLLLICQLPYTLESIFSRNTQGRGDLLTSQKTDITPSFTLPAKLLSQPPKQAQHTRNSHEPLDLHRDAQASAPLSTIP